MADVCVFLMENRDFTDIVSSVICPERNALGVPGLDTEYTSLANGKLCESLNA